ncbi:formylglycine-generating enzyme family protein [bacterium]|nr:formylglycine-generating enzyme family protein [bacterium]
MNSSVRIHVFLSLLLLAFLLACSNSEDSPIGPGEVNVISGMTFVSIPSGTFRMGDEDGYLSDECRPVHTVTVSSFEMSVYEVTNAQYASYLNEALSSGIIKVSENVVLGKGGEYDDQPYIDMYYPYDADNTCWIGYSSGVFGVSSGKENWPVVNVTWYGAKAFAQYLGFVCVLPGSIEASNTRCNRFRVGRYS